MKNPIAAFTKPLISPKHLSFWGGGVTFTLAIAAGVMWQSGWQTLRNVSQWTRIENQAPQADIATIVVEKIRPVSELTTSVFAMETVVPTSQDRQWGNVVVGRTQLLYIGYGEVRAGIDLSQITPANVQQKGDHLVVTLPAPQILDQKIDVNRSRIYDYDRGFLNLGPDTAPELQTLAQRETLSKIVNAACEQGILNEANQKAALVVQELLTHTGLKGVDVQITPPTHCAAPQT